MDIAIQQVYDRDEDGLQSSWAVQMSISLKGHMPEFQHMGGKYVIMRY